MWPKRRRMSATGHRWPGTAAPHSAGGDGKPRGRKGLSQRPCMSEAVLGARPQSLRDSPARSGCISNACRRCEEHSLPQARGPAEPESGGGRHAHSRRPAVCSRPEASREGVGGASRGRSPELGPRGPGPTHAPARVLRDPLRLLCASPSPGLLGQVAAAHSISPPGPVPQGPH